MNALEVQPIADQNCIIYSATIGSIADITDGVGVIQYGVKLKPPAVQFQAFALRMLTGTIGCADNTAPGARIWYDITGIETVIAKGMNLGGEVEASASFPNNDISSTNVAAYMKMNKGVNYGLVYSSMNSNTTLSFVINKGSLPFLPTAGRPAIISIGFTLVLEFI